MSEGELKTKITTDISGLKEGTEAASSQFRKVGDQIKGSFSDLNSHVSNQMREITSIFKTSVLSMVSLGATFTSAMLPLKAVEWGEMGAQLLRMEQAFTSVARASGMSADEILANLKRASGATMDASDVMQRAGRLMQEGIAPGKLTELMMALRKQAPIVGDTMAEAWDKIGMALTTGNLRIAKQYVGMVDLERELSKYAASLGVSKDRLTEQAKQSVIFEAILARLKETTKGLQTATENYSTSMARSRTEIKEAWEDIYKSMTPVADLLLKMSTMVMTGIMSGIRGLGSLYIPVKMRGAYEAEEKAAVYPSETRFVRGYAAELPKSPIAPRTPEQERELAAFRLSNQAKILDLQGFELLAIKKRHEAELAAEIDEDKRAAMRKRQAVEIAEFERKQIDATAEARIKSWGIMVDAQEEGLTEAALAEVKQARENLKLSEEQAEKYVENWGKAVDEREAQMTEALQNMALEEIRIEREKQRAILEGDVRAYDASLEAKKAEIALKYDLGMISATQMIGLEKNVMAESYFVHLEALNKEAALYEKYPEKYQEVMERIKLLKEKYNADLRIADVKLVGETKKTWDKFLDPISSAISTSIHGIISGTTTLSKAMNELLQNILLSFVDVFVKIGLEWVRNQILMAVFGQAIQKVTAVGQIITEAPVAAAFAYGSTAAIPIVGPGLALAAAAKAYGDVMKMTALVTAERGWDVDRTQMAMIHEKEMVLPAGLAEGFRAMFAGPGPSGGGWKPNQRTFSELGAAYGKGQGKAFVNALRGAAKNMGFKR